MDKNNIPSKDPSEKVADDALDMLNKTNCCKDQLSETLNMTMEIAAAKNQCFECIDRPQQKSDK